MANESDGSLMNWWLRLWRRRRLERDLADELAFHRQMRAGQNEVPPFGNETQLREQMRELWSFTWLESTIGDAVYALRGWRKNPAFALAVIASLSLAIGAVIAIYTAADELLFRPQPYADPGKLVMLWEKNRRFGETSNSLVSPENFLDWQKRAPVFEAMAYVDEGRSVFRAGDQSEELRVQRVSPNFFTTLGVEPVRGALVVNQSSGTSADETVVISYRLWQSWFGGDADVVGRRVQIDSFPRVIAAVMPPSFAFGDRQVDLWPYMTIRASGANDRGPRSLQVVARLKPQATLAQARAQMQAVARQLEHDQPQFNKEWTVTVESVRDAFTRNVRASLLMLLISVGLLLAVACANAANLLLARYSARASELAMRMALGAGRTRLIRQLLVEALLLALCSGACGLLLGRYALAGLVAIAPQVLTQTAAVSIDWRIAVFAIALSTASGLLFGLAPAFVTVREGSGNTPSLPQKMRARGMRRFRGWLILAETAMALVLLTCGTLLFRNLLRLQHANAGLSARGVLTFHFRVMSPADIVRFSQAIERMQKLPGVRSASATSFLPFTGSAASAKVDIEGLCGLGSLDKPSVAVRTVMPRYFESIGIAIRHGRDFTDADNTPQAPLRFLVNEQFVRKYLAQGKCLSDKISVGMARTNPYAQIIGVVGDVREDSLDGPAVPTVYYAYQHMPYGQMTLVVRAAGDPLALVQPVRRVMRELDPKLAVADVETMEKILRDTYGRERFLTWLMSGFSACAVLLAAIGIYGILAYSVSLRTQEIGIRQAVGADAGHIVRMILADGAWFVMSGLLVGTALALGASRLLASHLLATHAIDVPALILAPSILFSIALAAAYIPARRAARLHPIQALRIE